MGQEFNKELLYESKFNYYRVLNLYLIIIASFAEIGYFVSDCLLFERFAWETLVPRCAILIPMTIFILINKKCNNYKIMVCLSYITIHCAMWCTIWSIYYLPIKTHASEGFIIMHLMFLVVGLCSPPKYSIFFHSLVITNILFSHMFNHYENLGIMLSLGLPCLIGIELVLLVLNRVYKDHYLTKQELERCLYLDQLTQVFNRNIITKILKEDTNELNFDKCSIMLLDIDLFKNINDNYGHENGDKILKSIANNILQCIRKEDYLIRWGGEEFLILLPNCDKEEAIKVAKRINNIVVNSDNGVCDTSVSIGIAEYLEGDYHKTIVKADKALYYAKDNGRNQFKVYSEDLEIL